MKIRNAKIEDLKAIVKIYNQAISAGQKTADLSPVTIENRKKWFEKHPSDKYPIYIAEEDNEVLGYLTLSPYRPGREALRFTAELSYYIHFNYHRKGFASQLLEHAINKSPELNIKTLFAILLEGNEASIALLKKYRFEKWGKMPQVANFNGIELGHLYYGLRIEKE